jgi:hypothetical protein
MENRYFDYLCSLVGRSQDYSILLGELHKIEYYALIPNDDNRGEDGKQLRHQFIDMDGPHGSSFLPDRQCTVFEMLIGLSYRLEFETAQSRWEKAPNEWFWVLVDNLNLTRWTNMEIRSFNSTDDMHIRIDWFLSRDYLENGNGGLFPLKYPKKDQRRVEIWYQMSAYIMENYPM